MERNQEVERLTECLLGHANYRGYFSIEFKKDPRDNQLKLTEVNCRMPRSGWHAVACGANHPWLIYMDLVKNQPSDITDYKKGLYWIELYSDVFNSIFHHRKEDVSLRDFLRPYTSDHSFAVLDKRDMKPALKLAVTIPRMLLQKKAL